MKHFDVLDPALDVLGYRFLEASAGTGKTFAIENLYVRWILSGIPLRSILVVTFTRAATQELIERIHARLQKALKFTEEPHQKLVLEAALASFDEAKIFTIHGFCHAMLRRFFLQSECNLIFSEDEKESLNTALLPEFIDYLRGGIDAGAFSPLQLQHYFGGQFEERLKTLIKMYRPNIEDPLPNFDAIPKWVEKNLREAGSYSFTQLLEDFERFVIDKNKKRKVKLDPSMTPLFLDLIDKEKIGAKLCAGFSRYREFFGKSAATPDELLGAMQKALEKEDFLHAVQKQFEAVVIDEFQDTDQIQWEIFFRLFMQKRGLKAFCVVGDPKQSIYAFRDADLYTYLKAREVFHPEEHATLSVNYRSEKALVSALNALFAGDLVREWMRLPKTGEALEIESVEAVRDDSAKSHEIGNVHFVIAHGDEKNLFSYIASQIVFWSKQGVLQKEIVILIKDRFEARRLIEFLTNLNIKTHYRAVGNLVDSPVFEAVFDLIVALEKPRDLSRLKKVLAGPLLSWSEKELRNESFVEAMFGLQHLLSLFEERGLATCLKAFFEEPWSGKESAALILLRSEALDRYEDYKQLAEKLMEMEEQQNSSLVDLKLLLERMRIEKGDENKRPSIDDEAVQIMTIFQSKGLEYEIVFPLALATSVRRKEEDEEKIAEKMRLLYVALTRARRVVYIPWLIQGFIREEETAPSIIEEFLAFLDSSLDPRKIVAQLDSLGKTYAITRELLGEAFIVKNVVKDREHLQIPEPVQFSRHYPQKQLTSFSSLTKEEKGGEMEEKAPEEILPVGAETGKFVHELLENIFHHSLHHPFSREKITKMVSKMGLNTPFALLQEELVKMIEQLFQTSLIPFREGYPPFTLSEVSSSCLMPEMEFLYEQKGNLITGFIDLVFKHGELYYIIDWKTNWLPEYSPDQIEASILKHRYFFQAEIYTEALKRYVKLFDKRPFEECFGGAYYLYLRGMQWKRILP